MNWPLLLSVTLPLAASVAGVVAVIVVLAEAPDRRVPDGCPPCGRMECISGLTNSGHG